MSDNIHTDHDKSPSRNDNAETMTAKTAERPAAPAVAESTEILDLLGEDDGTAGSCSDGSCSMPPRQS